MTIQIPAPALRAVALFAARKDVRHYLKGVRVEASAKATRVTASDGNTLAIFQCPQENEIEDLTGVESFTIPIDTVSMVPRAAKFVTASQSELRTETGVTLSFKPVGGVFPDVRRVIPRQVSGQPSHINPDFITTLTKAAKHLGVRAENVFLHHNGTDGVPATLAGAPEFTAVLMPMRETEKRPFPKLVNDWAHRPIPGGAAA